MPHHVIIATINIHSQLFYHGFIADKIVCFIKLPILHSGETLFVKAMTEMSAACGERYYKKGR